MTRLGGGLTPIGTQEGVGGRDCFAPRLVCGVLLGLAVVLLTADAAEAQLGALVSPGRLSRPHAALEGVNNCLQCHSAKQQVDAGKCLACHKPVAERIARKTGIHRDVTTDCVKCHVEHAGVDAELRPFQIAGFDHKAQTGYALDGLHAPLAQQCASCHKTRSFLTVNTSCASCHADTHKGSLGQDCASCHTTSVRFAQTATSGFNHGRAAFPLTGAHEKVACASCHANKVYKPVAYESCASCHKSPHQPPLPGACASCHTTTAWRTTKVDHSRTAFPLKGKHATVACAQCHVKPATAVKPKSDTCASCHTDPHKGVFKQDCAACHNENGFQKGTFDHSATKFPLVDKHAGLACTDCHKDVVKAEGIRQEAEGRRQKAEGRRQNAVQAAARTPSDFRGLRTNCDSCHADVHRGDLGARCEACHTAKTFEVAPFTHAKPRPFFEGQHATATCKQCHVKTLEPVRASAREPALRVGFPATATTCVSCHADVHLGQVSQKCEQCHSIETDKFGLAGFSHATTKFALTGKHAPLACEACHKVETRAFPGGSGTARRLTGIGTDCVSCHKDPHEGQMKDACQSCHTVDSFHVTQYTHRNQRKLRDFFTGRHLAAQCAACHKAAPSRTAAGTTVVSYAVSTTCTSCHTDIHRGSLGPVCETCHKP